jgi:hypothetical protein
MPKAPFNPDSSDGCSVPKAFRLFVPAETDEQIAICIEHDRAYYCELWPVGGTRRDRAIADAKALLGWLEAGMNPDLAERYYRFVRDFGKPYWNNGGGRYSDEPPEPDPADVMELAGRVWGEAQ